MIELLDMLERRGVVTTRPDEAETCCGLRRDDDGFCLHRPDHPIYVGPAVPLMSGDRDGE